jgi:hypothetical protein
MLKEREKALKVEVVQESALAGASVKNVNKWGLN